MATFVLVHGAWHTGDLLEAVARPVRVAGHDVYTPTLAGNHPEDAKTIGLTGAIQSLVDYLAAHALADVVLVGHSYGGMVITGAADRVPERVRRLVYCNAFVPNDGECLNDMVPPHYVALFDAIHADSPDGRVMLPYPIWREAFVNDGDSMTAEHAYGRLVPQPYATFTEAIALSANTAAWTIPKSYIDATEDTALPQSLGWHPRLSEKLGLFRLHRIPGGHELCFTAPDRFAAAIVAAGAD